MKAAFSSSWISSKNPRKQRKYRFNAPAHIRDKFMHARLSKDLAAIAKKRSASIRKGDKVKILRGQFKGTEAEVDRVSRAYERIYVQGVTVAKKDGSTSFYPIHPSNVIITSRVEKKSDKKAVAAPKKEAAPKADKKEKEQ